MLPPSVKAVCIIPFRNAWAVAGQRLNRAAANGGKLARRAHCRGISPQPDPIYHSPRSGSAHDPRSRRVVERMNRPGGRLQQDRAALFRKYASASGDRCTLPIWPEPRISCSHPFSKTNFASFPAEHFERVAPLRKLQDFAALHRISPRRSTSARIPARPIFRAALCRAGQGRPQTTSASQLPVVSRGGIWDIIQSSIAARIATAAPMITCTVIAVVPWKPNTQAPSRSSGGAQDQIRLDLPRLRTSPAPLAPTIRPCSHTTRPRAMVVTGQPVTSNPSQGV